MFRCISNHFVTLHRVVQNGSHICYECTGLCSRNHFRVLSNKYSQPTPLDPKLMFGCVSDNTVTVHKIVQNDSHMCYECTGLCSRNHLQVLIMHQIHSIRPITHVWMCFAPFRYYAQSCAKRVPHLRMHQLCCQNHF